ncbi:excisionase family DNA-binding protein [Paraburkholderia bannensis]|uniref:excisionase family DNA-binding protein n=1 Tax=Paraburkholderia bannensis TaxID=765414 RepID=UPI002AB30848|nr:excisionase family DNA-binding protein [Paraburkholderia bannensis]
MTISEAATYLFVSRSHIRRLLDSGKLVEVLPRIPNAEASIDIASVEAYRLELDSARQAYQDSQAEDNGSLGR